MKKKFAATDNHDNQDISISISNQAQRLAPASLFFPDLPSSPHSPIKHHRGIVERLKQYHARPYYCPSFQIGLLLAALGGIITGIIFLESLLVRLHQQAATTFASHKTQYGNSYYSCDKPLLPCEVSLKFDEWSTLCWPRESKITGWLECCFTELIATCNDNKHYNRLIGLTRTGEVCLSLFGIAALVLLSLAVRNIHRTYQNNTLPLTNYLPENQVEIVDEEDVNNQAILTNTVAN